jgi:hypothetical protein
MASPAERLVGGDSAPAFGGRHVLCVAALLCLPAPVAAQGSSRTAVAFAIDSSWATGTACRAVLSLRQEPRRYRCHVESFKETPTEYVMRVRELSRDGDLTPPFSRSTVRLQKPSVTVTRVPDL